MMRDLADEVAREVRRAREMAELESDDAPHFLLETAIGRDHLNDGGHEAPRRALERGLGQLFLVAEVVMEQRLVDARLHGDLLHAGARGAAADEDGVRGVEDALLGVAVSFLFLAF